MKYLSIPEQLRTLRRAIETPGGEVDCFTIEPPAHLAQIELVEREIGRALPAPLRTFFRGVSPPDGRQWRSGHTVRRRSRGPWRSHVSESRDGDGHVFLATSFERFMRTWVRLACPGPDFDDLADYYDFEAQEISLDTAESRVWLEYLNSQAGS